MLNENESITNTSSNSSTDENTAIESSIHDLDKENFVNSNDEETTELSRNDEETTELSQNDREIDETARRSSFKPMKFSVDGEFPKFHSGTFQESESQKTDEEKINISEGFKTSEFFSEDSLLTNAEDFAQSIREGANLYKTELLKKIEQQATHTEKIHKKILSENEEAEHEREKLLSSTEEKVEEIKKVAFQKGYDDGYKVGIKQRYDESEPLAIQVNSVLENLSSLREVVRFQSEKELVALALQIAKNVVTEEVSLNNSVVENIVKVALQETEKQGKIYLYLNPEDYQFLIKINCDLDAYMCEEQNLVIRQKRELSPGSIFIESEGEIISRSIEGQFEKIETSLKEQIEKQEAQLSSVEEDAKELNLQTATDSEALELEKKVPSQFQDIEEKIPLIESDQKEDLGKDIIDSNSSSEEDDISNTKELHDLTNTNNNSELVEKNKNNELSEIEDNEDREEVSDTEMDSEKIEKENY